MRLQLTVKALAHLAADGLEAILGVERSVVLRGWKQVQADLCAASFRRRVGHGLHEPAAEVPTPRFRRNDEFFKLAVFAAIAQRKVEAHRRHAENDAGLGRHDDLAAFPGEEALEGLPEPGVRG